MFTLKRWMLYAAAMPLIVVLLTFPAVKGAAAALPARPLPQTASCPSFAFIKDVTIPDFSVMEPGATFEKTWRVLNDGDCAWPEGTELAFESGERLGAPASVAVGALAPGERLNISAAMKAPTKEGVYEGVWAMRDDAGETFGPRLTVVIKVGDVSAPPTPANTPTASASACLNSIYLADVTIPDYSTVEADKAFTKTWRVRNNGSCAWPKDAQLMFVDGDRLGASSKVTVGALDPGEKTEISVEMEAPSDNGSYRGVWRLSSGGEAAFGTKLTVVMRVGAAGSGGAGSGDTAGADTSGAVAASGTPTGSCLNASYVADVTIPDYASMEPGQSFIKTWRVRNSGTCAWPDDAQLTFSEGEALGAPAGVTVGALAPGATSDVSVNMAAPAGNGVFKGVWRMASGDVGFGTKLTAVIRVGAAPAPAAAAPVARPVGRGNFELGGHIRSWNYIPQMQSAGMTWAKIQVRYGEGATEMINMAHANGFKIQLSALGSPDMVVEPDFHAKFTAWVAGLAAAGADAIEVWNEPNIDREWQTGQINPASYTQLLCAAYGAIKGANPGTAVISAAPAPTGYFGGCGPNGCDDLPFIQGMYNAGAANCMDYIGAHHNAGATSPSVRSGHPADGGDGHHSWYFLPQTDLYYRTFGGARQLFYTEMGYASQDGVPAFSDQFWWARGTNNAQQAAWLAEAVNLSRSTGMVRCIIVWNIDFSRYDYDPQDGYAIIRPGGGCPACETLGSAMQ